MSVRLAVVVHGSSAVGPAGTQGTAGGGVCVCFVCYRSVLTFQGRASSLN